ncbi:hypothetical protein [Clostridium arbusti]|uniref:hypothetical protein n=1 Tax=Clostridium arbusti TaxID=1137848 RepID=UPI000288D519|nr:hypothetical protein [Clostridium arbusti]
MSLIDYKNNIINIGDIVKLENSNKGKLDYFVYADDLLYKYDKNGKIHPDKLGNIKIDKGVSLINNTTCKWINLGSKENVYYTIFQVEN